MKENKWEPNIVIEKLNASCNAKDFIVGLDRYNLSYQAFLRYFEQKPVLVLDDLIIGANFVYGWMPTILDFYHNGKDLNVALAAINKAKKAKKHQDLTDSDLELLKSIVNNSFVGVSKLLHCINPVVFAIWDSRVHRFLDEACGSNRKTRDTNNLNNFRAYHYLLDELECINGVVQIDFSNIDSCIINGSGKFTTRRKIELRMFLAGSSS